MRRRWRRVEEKGGKVEMADRNTSTKYKVQIQEKKIQNTKYKRNEEEME